jgi:hypothetical protein
MKRVVHSRGSRECDDLRKMTRMCSACILRYLLSLEPLPFRLSEISHQIEQEIDAIFDFLNAVYGLFGFELHLELSTRPENFLGRIETWDEAERVSLI